MLKIYRKLNKKNSLTISMKLSDCYCVGYVKISYLSANCGISFGLLASLFRYFDLFNELIILLLYFENSSLYTESFDEFFVFQILL